MEEAASLYEQALAIAREQESRRLVAMVMFNLSLVYGEIGENEQGERLALEALSIHREIGNRRSEGLALGQVGWFEQMRGAYAQATTHVLGALAIHREIGNRRGEASMLAELGEFEQVQGRMEEAIASFIQPPPSANNTTTRLHQPSPQWTPNYMDCRRVRHTHLSLSLPTHDFPSSTPLRPLDSNHSSPAGTGYLGWLDTAWSGFG
jgi:tetratricopeptide (TPR) repeat protein